MTTTIELKNLQDRYGKLARERNNKLVGKYGIFCPLKGRRDLVWGGGDYWYESQELLDKENEEMAVWDEEHGVNQVYQKIVELQDKRHFLYNQLCQVRYGCNAEVKRLKDHICWCEQRIRVERDKIKEAAKNIERYEEDIFEAREKIEKIIGKEE